MKLDDPKVRNSIYKTLIWDANSHLDICEMLRLTYDLVYEIEDKELKGKITERLVDVMMMAKRMAERLTYYRTTYKDETGHSGNTIDRFYGHMERKQMRRNRL